MTSLHLKSQNTANIMKWKLFLSRFLLPAIMVECLIYPAFTRLSPKLITFIIAVILIIILNLRKRFFTGLVIENETIKIDISNAFFISKSIIIPTDSVEQIILTKGQWGKGKKPMLTLTSAGVAQKIVVDDDKTFNSIKEKIGRINCELQAG